MTGLFTWAEILEGKHLIGFHTPTRKELMTLQDYQELAGRTLKVGRHPKDAAANMAMGLAGEAGEVCDYLKKVLFHDHNMDRKALALEIGDVLWYLAGLCSRLGMNLEDVAQMNIDKLKARYPNGFTEEASRAR